MKNELTKEQYSYILRLTIIGEEKFFGPGVSTLMHHVDNTGSLRKSCAIMGMAYSKAWKIFKIAEKNLGFPLIVGSTGGAGGGKSTITPQGRDFLERYDAFISKSAEVVDSLFQEYFPN